MREVSIQELESKFTQHFDSSMAVEVGVARKLLELFGDCIQILNTRKEPLHSAETDIRVMMGSNLNLLGAAIQNIRFGYYRPTVVLLRTVMESVVLGMYFFEFPGTLEEYKKDGHRRFFKVRGGWLEVLVKKLEEEGQHFNKNSKAGAWNKMLIEQRIDVFSKFSHVDLEFVHKTSMHSEGKGYVIGPQMYPANDLRDIVKEIVFEIILSLSVLQKSSHIELKAEEDLLVRKALRDICGIDVPVEGEVS